MYLDGTDKENLFNNVKTLLEIQNNKTLALKASVFFGGKFRRRKWFSLVDLCSCLLLLSFDWLILSSYLVNEIRLQ